MEANKNGVAFTRPELRALREFGSKEPTDVEKFGVHVQIKEERVYARASNSRIFIRLDGVSDKKHRDGEWFVNMKLLIDGRKQLEGKEVLRLLFSGASLRTASIESNGVKRLTLSSEADAAHSKPTFPEFDKDLKIPSKTRTIVHCAGIAGPFMKAASLAGEAVDDELIEFFMPSKPDGMIIFRAGADKQTSVIGGIFAGVTAEAVSEDEDEDDEEEAPKRGRKKNPKQPELPSAEAS